MNLLKLAAVGAMTMAATCSVGLAQSLPEGRVYSFHSGPQGGCPGLDWHVVAQGNSLDGMIAWNNMKSMAHATGSMNPTARTFEMTAKEVGGQDRTATITGSVRSDGWLIANIKGPSVNCQNVAVQWFTPSQSGGG